MGKSILFLLVLSTMCLLVSCKKESDGPSLGKPFFVKHGETVDIPGEMSISFFQLVEDSRCSCTADCLTEGTVLIKLMGSVNGRSFICPMIKNSFKQFNGYEIKLLEILPEPCDIELPIPLEKYEAKVVVKEVE